MFSGEFHDVIGESGVLAVPAALNIPNGATIVAFADPACETPCACLYGEADYKAYRTELAESLAFWNATEPASENAALLNRALNAAAHVCTVEDGRLELPAELLARIGVDGACVLVGADDHLELYAAEQWAGASSAFGAEDDIDFSELF